jgi:hypothetical protein
LVPACCPAFPPFWPTSQSPFRTIDDPLSNALLDEQGSNPSLPPGRQVSAFGPLLLPSLPALLANFPSLLDRPPKAQTKGKSQSQAAGTALWNARLTVVRGLLALLRLQQVGVMVGVMMMMVMKMVMMMVMMLADEQVKEKGAARGAEDTRTCTWRPVTAGRQR